MPKYHHSGRTEQTKAAMKRRSTARRLQAQRRWRGAMYLAGYSVECKLKARLMEVYGLHTLEQLELEVERRLGRPVSLFTHSIEVLFGLTGARERLLRDPKRLAALRSYQTCNAWRPAWRYSADDGTEDACTTFMGAVEEFGQFIDHNI
ncbi:MAG: hypothetical protein JNM72_02500 [Deltaproteobacteria bacterium]|nr:hypothetical protein [Deltaproteobacteria bacterium]